MSLVRHRSAGPLRRQQVRVGGKRGGLVEHDVIAVARRWGAAAGDHQDLEVKQRNQRSVVDAENSLRHTLVRVKQ